MSLCSFLVLIATSFLQLASDPDAEELLVDTLLAFEEADKLHCARFSGTLSGIQEGEPKIIEVFGVSAKNRDLEFHSYGSQGPAGVQWFNALRVAKPIVADSKLQPVAPRVAPKICHLKLTTIPMFFGRGRK